MNIDSSQTASTRSLPRDIPRSQHQHDIRASICSVKTSVRKLLRSASQRTPHHEANQSVPRPGSIRTLSSKSSPSFASWAQLAKIPSFQNTPGSFSYIAEDEQDTYDTDYPGCYTHSAQSSQRNSWCGPEESVAPVNKRPPMVSRTTSRRRPLAPMDFPDPIKDLYIFRNPESLSSGKIYSSSLPS